MQRSIDMDGILNINKPAGMTSHDVVARLRRILHEKKIGHTGTLDPDATGVLPICVGKATKIIQYLQEDNKGYEGTITLGIATDTLDASGEILEVSDISHVNRDDVKRAFSDFVGEIDQIPPMVSALKVDGTRLYKMARQGKTIERKPRRIHIYELELLDFRTSIRDLESSTVEGPISCVELDFRVRCSRGTYVRSLAADIGNALECGAHLSRLTRTKSGIFELSDSIKLEEIQADPQQVAQVMQSMDNALSHLSMISITGQARKLFLDGVPVRKSAVVRYEGEFRVDDVIRVHDESGMFMGLGKATDSYSPNSQVDTADPRDIICKVEKMLNEA